MKYDIITINDDRAAYKLAIRQSVRDIPEVFIPAVNAMESDVPEELEKRGLTIPNKGSFSVGEVGIWLSMFDCWKWAMDNEEELIVFEDDAQPAVNFEEQLHALLAEIPEDYDFVSLWIPPNQLQDFRYLNTYDDEGLPTFHGNLPDTMSIFNFGADRAAKVYNGYGNVAQLFSPVGARKLVERAQSVGLYSPVDCFQYQEAHAGRLNGYAPKPQYATLVDYDWLLPTTVHMTPRFGEIYK